MKPVEETVVLKSDEGRRKRKRARSSDGCRRRCTSSSPASATPRGRPQRRDVFGENASELASEATAGKKSDGSENDETETSLQHRVVEVFLRQFLKVVSRHHQRSISEIALVFDELQETLRSRQLSVELYGSMRTGIVLPTSDLDLCVTSLSKESEDTAASRPSGLRRGLDDAGQERMRCTTGALRHNRKFTNVIRIAHARVPIVKCMHRSTQREIDVSFTSDGVQTSILLSNELGREENVMARGLIVMAKALLSEWGLGDPSCGGLGSFAVSLMVLWFLRSEAEHYIGNFRRSYSVLLMGFLKYYSHDFDFRSVAIDYGRLSTFVKSRSAELVVTNPLDPSRNTASACTKFASDIQPRFAELYRVLLRLTLAPSGSGSDSGSGSFPKAFPTLMRLFKKTVDACGISDAAMFHAVNDALEAAAAKEQPQREQRQNGGRAVREPELRHEHRQNVWDARLLYVGGNYHPA